ncbi:MAG: twin-arginine translocase TatA/TatE family subunit [Longimicrobiales bacterium]
MGFGSFGPWEILLILVLLLLVFGAKRLPELGGALGKGIREFKSSIRSIESDLNTPSDDTTTTTTPPRQVHGGTQPRPADSATKSETPVSTPGSENRTG